MIWAWFLTLGAFFLKYGPSLFSLIKSAVDLWLWLRKQDPLKAAPKAEFKAELHAVAKLCQLQGSKVPLECYVAGMQSKKDTIMAGRS